MLSTEDILLNTLTYISAVLYIYCEIVLYLLMRENRKKELSAYFHLVFYCGLVHLLSISNQTFFRLLPAFVWQTFFISLGEAGAKIHFMLNYGTEVFVILCEAFIAISRYLTFSSNDVKEVHWNLNRIRKALLIILIISTLYACIYLFCPFEVNYNKAALGRGVTYNFKVGQLQWVGTSNGVSLVAGLFALSSCTYCYYKTATIIKASQSGLNRGIVLKMCLSSLIISFGLCLSLVARSINFLSFVIAKMDLIPISLYLYLVKIGSLIAACGTPWILLALFPVVRHKAFPCICRDTQHVFVSPATTTSKPQ
ncbi:hypothetical protein Q1695_010847 [Nippostrongylus brasiliensis]|nr:hypothetical protein Q1695_010847 [Nippostrongylus brasiliensis]